MPLPTAIFFDMDDTLLDAYAKPLDAWRRLLGQHAGLLGAVAIEDLLAAILAHSRPFWGDRANALRWRQDIAGARRQVVRLAFASLNAADHPSADFLADAFTRMRHDEYRLFPDTIATLDGLRAQGVRLALITNGASDMQRHKIERFDLARHFDHIQIEGEFGRGKPELDVYHHALSRMAVSPAQTWMVGDNLEWDVLAPQSLGIHGIWYDFHRAGLAGAMHTGVAAPMPEAKPDRIIHRLTELLEIR